MLLQQLGWEKGSADWDVIDTFVRIFHTHCQQKAPDVRGGYAAVDQAHMCAVTQELSAAECVFWRNGVGPDPPAPPRSLKQYLHMWKPDTALLRVCPPLSSTVRSVAPYVWGTVAAPHQSPEPKVWLSYLCVCRAAAISVRHKSFLNQVTALCYSKPRC